MKTLKIHYFDGSFQLITPQQDPNKENTFNGDWRGLAQTVSRMNFRTAERPYRKHELL